MTIDMSTAPADTSQRRRGPVDPRLWRYSSTARGYLVLTVLTSLVDVAMVVVSALMIGTVLAGVITTDARSVADWNTQLAILAAAIGIRVVATWLHGRYAHRSATRVIAELENEVLDAAAAMPPRELDPRRDEIATVLTRGLDGLAEYLTGYIPALLLAVTLTPATLVVIALHDLTSAIIIVVTLPLIPIFMVLIGLLTKGKSDRTLDAMTTLSSQLLDLLAGLPTLRALGREKGPAGRVRELGDDHRRTTMSALRVAFLSGTVLEFLATLSVALVAVSIGMRLVYGGMPLEAGIIALILAPEAYLPLRTVGSKFHAAEDGMAAAQRAFAVLDSTPGRARPDAATNRRPDTATNRRPDAGNHAIVFDALSVAGRSGHAPHRLDATCRPGTVTALTGPNGSGKSTALLALLGLADAAEGAVTVDGVSVHADDRWWSQVAWLPQRPVLIPGTLADNLALTGADPTETELAAVCAATGFDSVLAELPDGWNTVVGEGGTGLSLGQRQRLALTRTLASPRQVLLLDEPTAHLDDDTEAHVLDTVRALARDGRTVIVVAHRPALLAIADEVVTVRSEGEPR